MRVNLFIRVRRGPGFAEVRAMAYHMAAGRLAARGVSVKDA